jgi:hypothetical protein
MRIAMVTVWGSLLVFANTFPSYADKRVALVIGNSNYTSVAALPNPERDAEAVTAALRNVGFQMVTMISDAGRDALVKALDTFAREADTADWALVYFAGHGIEVGGTNYLIPVDARLVSDRDVSVEAISLDQIMTYVEGAKKLRVVILDACRDNPFVARMLRRDPSRSIGRGLARYEPAPGSLVVFAAKEGQIALDGDAANSPFATAFLKNLKVPNLDVRRLFDLVRDDVMETTDRRQQPFAYSSVSGREEFYFLTTNAALAPITPPETTDPIGPSQQSPTAPTVRPKIPDRTEPGKQAPAALSAAQKVVLYEEDPADPNGKRFVGSAIWRTETITPGRGQRPELAIRADVEVLERKLAMTWSLRRNTDKGLPATHTVEIMFKVPADFPAGGISNVSGILMKQAEQIRGVPLAGLAVKVTPEFYLIRLSNVKADKDRNTQLLKERNWFDIAVIYKNNQRAIIAIEKGPPGENAFAEAFKAWSDQAAK